MVKKSIFTTKKIAYAAIFIAISVAINTMRIGSISFGGFPIIFSGYVLGPLMGFIVGALADVVGFLIRPSATGGFNPLFVLTSALTGAIPIIITRLLGDKYPNYKLWKIFLGIFIGQTITSVVMVPIFISLITGKNTVWYYIYKAAAKQIVSIPIYAILLKAINDTITKHFDFR
ncbi:folate family ECF transporter S component [Tissierella sp. MB52-C2]|uniref:folate family ECF transporter S component n=1 Tax=Tissierella sp. MB52-C2 TaxID=3070999 RepID=UPI00280B4D30|nr:folate family ECF transporter S component [Tissierella sp. MB52-C2]WMM23384.1 folate family ECF transporter S component [Tissierella sp. MB52-C2]